MDKAAVFYTADVGSTPTEGANIYRLSCIFTLWCSYVNGD